MGIVGATAAADYLLRLAGSNNEAAKDAVFPAPLADTTIVWPKLLSLARSTGSPHAARTQAVFWLGQSNDPRALALFEELLTLR